MEEKIKEIFKAKLEAGDPYYKYNITPDMNDPGWDDAVEEGRGRGIPIKCFGDTSDKMVFHPGHLGYNFDYFWGRENWASNSCWNEDADPDAIDELLAIGEFLAQKFKVQIVQVSGSNKGYLSTKVYEFCRYSSCGDNYDVVLFVYGINNEYMKNVIAND